jgi:CSLREA domain-containing protein
MDISSSWGDPLAREKENMVGSRLKGRISLLVLAFAVVMLIFPATAFAQVAGDSTGTSALAPTIQSDRDDYAPIDVVTLTGSNWQPGETVNINVNDDDGQTWNRNVDVIADENGNVRDEFQLPAWFVAKYTVTATGSSGAIATTTFTDAVLPGRGCDLPSSPGGPILVETPEDELDPSSQNGTGCSLREAIAAANGDATADTITLPAGLYTLTRTGNPEDDNARGDLDIIQPLTINGANARTTTIHGNGTASQPDRVLHVRSNASLNLSNATVTSGRSTQTAGGGIRSDGRPMSLTDVTIAGNSVTNGNDGGGIYNTGGVLTINRATIVGNSASGNASADGGGLYTTNNATLTNVTITNNSAVGSGGGFRTDGGTSTFTNVTVSHNNAATGSNIRQDSGTLNLRNTIVSIGTCSDNNGLVDVANNLDSGTSCEFGTANGSKSNANANLGPLQNNGGQTDTRALLAIPTISAAIDAGTATGAPGVDQRGVSRPQGPAHDIGAFEAPPVNAAPNTPGQISSDELSNNDGTFTLSWSAANPVDPDQGDSVTYTLEQKDNDDGTTWSPVASGLQSASYTFGASNPEPEGTWDFRVKAVDSHNASSGFSTKEDLVNVDKTNPNAPALSFATTGQSPKATVNGVDWYKGSALVNVASNGDPNNVRDNSTGSGVDPNSFAASFSVTQNGASTASKTVKDKATNESAAGTLSVHVDANAPTSSFDGATNANGTYSEGAWTNKDVTVTLKATDNESGVDEIVYNTDGSNNYLTYPAGGILVDQEGTTTINFHAVDNVGHVESPDHTFQIKLDKTAPVISDLGPTSQPNTNGWYNTNVTNLFKASDPGSGLSNACKADFPLTAGENVQSKTTSGEGSAVKVTSDGCSDVAGNSATGVQSAGFKVDLTNPTADHSLSANANANGWHNANVTVTLTASDKDALGGTNASGVKEINYSINNGPAQLYTNGISLTNDGVYIIKYTATDNAGRVSAEGSVTVKLDKTKPVITDEGLTPADPDGQNGWYVTEVSNGFKASDGQSGFVGQNDPYTFSKSSGFVAHDPAFKISSGTVTDKAGNESLPIDGKTFKIDMKAPAPPSAIDLLSDTGTNTNDDVTSDRTPEFSVTAEPGSTVELFYQTTSGLVSVDSELANASGVAHLIVPDGKALTDGTYTFVAKATDEAGNVSLVSNDDSLTVKVQRDVTVDGTAPTSNATPDQPANAAGWHKANVTVTLNAGDGQGSGVEELVYSSTANSAQQISSTTVLATQLPAQVLINTEGTTTINFHAVDKAGNVESPAKTFTVKLDKTAPQVTSNQPTSSPNANGWYNTDVTNRFTFSDGNGSGLANPADATIDKTTSVEGTAVNVNSGPVSDLAGNTNPGVESASFKIDKTKPEITVGLPTIQPNEAGWYNSKVTNNFTADDALSGFASNSGSVNHLAFTKDSGTQEGASVLISSGTVFDLAGNEAIAKNAGPFKIDRTPPAANCGSAPSTWSKVDVSIHCAPTDGLSGLASAGDASFDLSTSVPEGTETANASTDSRSVADVAGNTVTAGPITGIKVDKKAPALVSDGPTTNPNGAGWYKTAVTNGFTATDGGSGIAPNGVPSDSFTRSSGTAEGLAVKIFSDPVSDAVGNTNPGIYSAAFKIDLSDPYNVTFQGGPAAGASYDFGNSVPAQPTCTASDDLSGLKSCVVSGYSNAVGTHTMTATATDNAGRTATATRTYTVLAAKATGFYQPVDMNGVLNTVKGGSTVPVKFELFGGATNVEQKVLSAVGSMSASKVSCAAFTGDPVDAIEYLAPTSENTGLRFDLTGDQFIYNWKTPRSPNTCYSLTMTAADNTTKLVAYFKLT